MPRGGEPFDEACTHWEKGIIDLARVSLLNNIRKSFTDCFIHKNVIKVLSGLQEKDRFRAQIQLMIGEQFLLLLLLERKSVPILHIREDLFYSTIGEEKGVLVTIKTY